MKFVPSLCEAVNLSSFITKNQQHYRPYTIRRKNFVGRSPLANKFFNAFTKASIKVNIFRHLEYISYGSILDIYFKRQVWNSTACSL